MMHECEVTSLAEMVDTVLSSGTRQEDIDRRVLAIEEEVSRKTPTNASGALYQALLLREAADLLHSWAPDSGEGAEICKRYARMADALGAGVVSFLRSVGGSLPAEIEAYHSFEWRGG